MSLRFRRTLALVGRPNVGKSALFNRLAGKDVSLVHDRPGVTRDRVVADVLLGGHPATLVDTGGIGLEDTEGFDQAIRREVEVALASASAVILVVDGREGVHVLDQEVARLLRKSGLPVLVAANKLDTASLAERAELFRSLGFREVVPVSAAHGTGIRELVERLTAGWEKEELEVLERPALKVAVVGVPNVGKSALVNSLLGQERVLVSPVAGTTRDSVDIPFTVGEERWSLIDTAGMRKRSRVRDTLEAAMTARTAHAINRSDLCVLVLDAGRGVGEQEKKIAGLIREAGKACVIFVNKWDLARARASADGGQNAQTFREQYREAVRQQLFFLEYAPVVFGSALESRGGGELLARLEEVRRARDTQVGTGVFNRLLVSAQRARPLKRVRGGGGGKIFYGTQLRRGDLPCPTFALFLNRAAAWDESYGRYLEGLLRRKFPFPGCPIRWEIRERSSSTERAAGGRRPVSGGLSED